MRLRLGLGTTVLSVIVTAAACAPTAGATTVSGTEYAVSFQGTATEDVTWDDGPDCNNVELSGEQKGTWTIRDAAELGNGMLWLPRTANAAEETASSRALTYPPGFGPLLQSGIQEPAAITESGKGPANDGPDPCGTVSYTASLAHVFDGGASDLQAAVTLGKLVVSSTPDESGNVIARIWQDQPVNGSGSSIWTVSDHTLISPPQFGYVRGGMTYAATVPFANVGMTNFSLPVTPAITANPCDQNSYSPGEMHTGCAGHVTLTGAYTFKKLCDGTISYSGTSETGKCGSVAKPPDTKIVGRKVKRKTATFKFKATGGKAPVHFVCKLDKGSFKTCSSPKTYTHLKKGKHTFSVEAVDAAGLADPTPATQTFKIK
jgi:hypothetical protein